jgi:hypothetical protein
MTRAAASALAGISASTWSHLERGRDGRVTLATWNHAASAVGGRLHAYIERASGAAMPRDAVHLRNQELVMRTAQLGGWRGLPEVRLDADARTSRMADLVLRRANDWALCEIYDWFEDVGAAGRAWQRRLDALERYAIARMRDETLPCVGGMWVLRARQRNRRLVREHRQFFRALLPGSAAAWLASLMRPDAPMPDQPALMWVAVKGDRLYGSRLT